MRVNLRCVADTHYEILKELNSLKMRSIRCKTNDMIIIDLLRMVLVYLGYSTQDAYAKTSLKCARTRSRKSTIAHQQTLEEVPFRLNKSLDLSSGKPTLISSLGV